MMIIIFILLALYFYALYDNQKKIKNSLLAKQIEYNKSEQLLFDNVEEILGEYDLDRLKNEKIWQDMPKCLIYYSWGEPHNIKKNVSSSDLYEYWYYGPKPYRYGGETRYKYETQIDIHNSFVTGWKDL